MLPPLENLPRYSPDLWDYLPDMKHLPGRADRDNLLAAAHRNPEEMKRVHLWDYFFRVHPQDVGRPLQREMEALHRQLNQGHRQYDAERQKMESSLVRERGELRKVEEALAGYERDAETLAQSRVGKFIGKKRRMGGLILVLGGFFWILFLLAIFSTPELIGACVFVPALLISVAGGWKLYKAQDLKSRLAEMVQQETTSLFEKKRRETVPRIEQLQRFLQDGAQYLSNIELGFRSAGQQYEHRLAFLSSELQRLRQQIPPAPSDEQVDLWLKEDIQELKKTAIKKSGMQERLIPVLNGENPFCVRGPAELQSTELIPPPYQEKSSDRNKHLRAKTFTIMPDGTFADFYGVYNIEFILVSEEVLATYGTIYDFITGRQSGERAKRQNYINVVTIETLKGYREIVGEDGSKISMENVPSLTLSLTDGKIISVTFPDEDYFKQSKAHGFGTGRWRFDPREAAENAISIIREKADEAQRRRDKE